MTDSKIKEEFNKWIDNKRPMVWWKHDIAGWCLSSNPSWDPDIIFIIDNEDAEMRKALYDIKESKEK